MQIGKDEGFSLAKKSLSPPSWYQNKEIEKRHQPLDVCGERWFIFSWPLEMVGEKIIGTDVAPSGKEFDVLYSSKEGQLQEGSSFSLRSNTSSGFFHALQWAAVSPLPKICSESLGTGDAVMKRHSSYPTRADSPTGEGTIFKKIAKNMSYNNYEGNQQGSKKKIIMMERMLMIGWLEDLFEEITFKLSLIAEIDVGIHQARRERVL